MRQADPAISASAGRPVTMSTSPSPSRESYAVIGGEGFLGAALVSALLGRHPVSRVASLGLTQRRFDPEGEYRFFRTDITSRESIVEAFRASGATTVFHTASPHANATPEMWQKVNVQGTEAVVQACREAGVRKLVFTSSMTAVYRPGVPLTNVDERLPRIETEEKVPSYAGTKVRLKTPLSLAQALTTLSQAAAEKIVLDANGKDGLLTCAIRLGGIIGCGYSSASCACAR